MGNETQIYEFESAMHKIKWDIVRISETRREGERLVKRKNGNYFYLYGEKKGYRGTGFYVRGKIMK